MPAKKKSKRKTAAKRTTRKKTGTSSSKKKKSAKKTVKRKSAAKKPAKKKAPAKRGAKSRAKKKTTKKTAKKTARRTRKKSAGKIEAAIPAIKPSFAAGDMHSRQTHIQNTEPPVQTNKEVNKKRFLFSFPNALSEVRSTVKEAKPAPVIKQGTPQSKADNSEPSTEQSPYVLDLKRGMTLIYGAKSYSAKKLDESQPKQGILSVFDDPVNKSLAASFSRQAKSFKNSLWPTKQINLARLERRQKSAGGLKKWWYRFLYRLKNSLYSLQGAMKGRRMQSAMSFDQNFAPRNSIFDRKVKVNFLSEETRGGSPIPVKSLKTAFKKKQAVEEAGRAHRASKFVNESISGFVKKQMRPKPRIEAITFKRILAPFVALSVFVTLPFVGLTLLDYVQQSEEKVFGATDSAVKQLQEARLSASQFSFLEASEKFEQAGQAFAAAGQLIENQFGIAANALSFLPLVGEKVDAATGLLEAGRDLSSAASSISQGVSVFTDENHFLAEEPTSYKLEYLLVHWQDARPYLKAADRKLEDVDTDLLPEDIGVQVKSLQDYMPGMIAYSDSLQALMEPLLTMLGHESMQRYLVLFQNNTELRATGGFMGSLALVDLDRAEIENIEIPGGGPYDFQGTLFENYQSPRALQLINPRWELQDANWFFDWPTSAVKVATLYEKAGGPTVDGVIAINTNVLQKLLEFTGPISFEEYDTEISAENFREILQNHVEFEYDEELNQPKKIIGDLAPKMLERLKNLEPEELLTAGSLISESLNENDILIHHEDEEVANAFSGLGWAGEVEETDSDYLAVVHTNLAGGKTDAVIQDTFDLTVHIDEKDQTTNTLTITRKHTGEKGVPLIGVRNVDYLRVYVPLGSQLIEASGFEQPPRDLFEKPNQDWLVDEDLDASQGRFALHHDSQTEIYQESGKTVFANWVQVDPGQTVEIKLVYKTPLNIKKYELPTKESSWTDWFTGATAEAPEKLRLYSLYWQKQSGVWSPEMSVNINYPQAWEAHSKPGITAEISPGLWSAEAVMKGDSVWSVLFN